MAINFFKLTRSILPWRVINQESLSVIKAHHAAPRPKPTRCIILRVNTQQQTIKYDNEKNPLYIGANNNDFY